MRIHSLTEVRMLGGLTEAQHLTGTSNIQANAAIALSA